MSTESLPYIKLSLMAEIKRASPSRGVISLDACAPAQARLVKICGREVQKQPQRLLKVVLI